MTDYSPNAANGADRAIPPIADITARPPAPTAEEKAFSDTVAGALKEAKAMFEVKAQALTEQAKETFASLKAEAAKRSAQGVEVVKDKPYAAVGVAALAGFLLGHLISAGRPQVIYLKDHR